MFSTRKALLFLRAPASLEVAKYSADQPRDAVGQWCEGPGVPAHAEGDARVKNLWTSGRGAESMKVLRGILKGALKIPHVRALLDRVPLDHLVREPREGSRGCYSPSGRYVKLNATPREKPKKPFVPGKLFSVSSGLDDATYERATLVHELGHHLMFQVPGVEALARDAYQRMQARPVPAGLRTAAVSRYAEKDHGEYFAECFAAYSFKPDALRAHDPEGHAMVEAALRHAGVGK